MIRKLDIVFSYPQTEDLKIIEKSNALREIRRSKYLKYFLVEIISIAEGVDFRKNDHLRDLIPSIFKNIPKFITSKLLKIIEFLIKDKRRIFHYREDRFTTGKTPYVEYEIMR